MCVSMWYAERHVTQPGMDGDSRALWAWLTGHHHGRRIRLHGPKTHDGAERAYSAVCRQADNCKIGTMFTAENIGASGA